MLLHPVTRTWSSSLDTAMRFSLSFLVIANVLLSRAKEIKCQTEEGECDAHARVSESCTLVYAPIPLGDSEDGNESWGVFSLTDRPKGTPVWRYGDVVLQVPDASVELRESKWYRDMVWDAQETGGHYEGHNQVHSIVPGLGMMARTKTTDSSLLPFVPRFDEGGLTRFESPGAGAITHYHNYTWYIRQPVAADEELTMPTSLRIADEPTDAEPADYPALSKEELMATGYCLDNLRPRKSRLKEAGRGAFATQNIPAGAVVAPVPVLPVNMYSLEYQVPSSKKKFNLQPHQKEQLLKNYCFGSKNSTTLLFPYGPMVNLINHYTEANVRVQWSQRSLKHLSLPLSTENVPFLLMELVAIRDIQRGEEVYLDYGRAWEEAWYQHRKSWKPADMHYTPSYVMDDAIRLLRTQQEQKDHEYPANIFTSCFYRYSDRETSEKSLSQPESSDTVTSFRWKFTKGLYDLKHLRPCEVLRRAEDQKGRSAYAVRILNRPGLPEDEVIPKGDLHIVTHIPRQAIRFSDKAGTTDPHLPNSFRHEIGLGDGLFPAAWEDLQDTGHSHN